jgi:N-acetylmuramoyl-L-alanine amidase
MKKIVIIDCGHGSLTRGKQSPDGSLREFDNNRLITIALSKLLNRQGYKHFVLLRQWLNPTIKVVDDISLGTRQHIANSFIHLANPADYLLLSIHSNANSMGNWQPARGIGTWLNTQRKDLANVASVFSQQIALSTGIPLHGTGVHYADFAMNRPYSINKTTNRASGILCDSMILEVGFHDNRQDIAIMKQEKHPENVAKGIVKALEFLY